MGFDLPLMSVNDVALHSPLAHIPKTGFFVSRHGRPSFPSGGLPAGLQDVTGSGVGAEVWAKETSGTKRSRHPNIPQKNIVFEKSNLSCVAILGLVLIMTPIIPRGTC